jgi:hypothetical protein
MNSLPSPSAQTATLPLIDNAKALTFASGWNAMCTEWVLSMHRRGAYLN